MEVSYHQLSIKEAIDIMKCTNEDDLRDYITSARDDWIISEDIKTITCTFQPDGIDTCTAVAPGATHIPTQQDIPSTV